MAHIAIVEQLEGKSTDWMEKVTEEQYRPVRGQSAPNASTQTAQPTPAQRLIGDYGGWPSAMTAVTAAKEVFEKK